LSRNAIITGAGGGLAQAVARLLAEQGWSLALVGRDRQAMTAVRHDLEQNRPGPRTPIRVALVEADVSTGEGASRAVATAEKSLEGPIHGLAHCAGNVFLQAGHQTTDDQYRTCLAANLDTAFFTLGAFTGALLKKRTRGAAVLVSSVAAQVGVPRHEAMAAAKGGVEALVRSAAATYAPRGIRINGVAPGLMRTGATERFFANPEMEKVLAAQYPLGRWGDVLDTAAAVAYLLSDQAAWITGQVLAVDGGFTALKPMPRVGGSVG